MWGAASILFRCARCSGTPVWARGAGPAAAPPTASPSLLGGGRPPGSGGAEGRACGSPAGGGAGGGVGGPGPLPALGPEWEGGGSGGGPLVPWRRLLTAGGGAAWQSRPRGPAIGWGVAPFPRPPLPRAGPSCRPSLGPLIPPAVVAGRRPAGGGREG